MSKIIIPDNNQAKLENRFFAGFCFMALTLALFSCRNNKEDAAKYEAGQQQMEQAKAYSIAKAEAERLVRQEEVVQQAQAFAEDIKNSALRHEQEVKEEADAYAERVKMDVLQYADDMLAYLSGNLQSALQGLNDNRNSVNDERRKLAAPQEYYGDEIQDDEEEK